MPISAYVLKQLKGLNDEGAVRNSSYDVLVKVVVEKRNGMILGNIDLCLIGCYLVLIKIFFIFEHLFDPLKVVLSHGKMEVSNHDTSMFHQ